MLWCKGTIYAQPRAYDSLAGTAATVAVQPKLRAVPYTLAPCCLCTQQRTFLFLLVAVLYAKDQPLPTRGTKSRNSAYLRLNRPVDNPTHVLALLQNRCLGPGNDHPLSSSYRVVQSFGPRGPGSHWAGPEPEGCFTHLYGLACLHLPKSQRPPVRGAEPRSKILNIMSAAL